MQNSRPTLSNSPHRFTELFRLLLTIPLAIGATLLLPNLICQAQDPFAENIRTTEPLSPAEALAAFKLPPGFEIQLVAAEPAIQKPMNMAFDAHGRIWITDTREYPLPLPVGEEGRDSIKILEDEDGDGTAEKVTTFADGLNIPIGLYPYKNGCIVFSIPHIWWLEDTDGDSVADRRSKLYGPMGYDRDTHGLNNSFRRGYDGWLYACHGFNNHTTVAGRDGHEIQMQSGNTYRMRLDGERVEHFTWGQVNPFGMALDAWGNFYTADCHSKPIYQLLRGGYYPSFGKPHDGLGFVTPMMDHLHGSTAIAGLAVYDANRFPAEYRDNFFSGNVMTSRVNRNSIRETGSTLAAVEQPDFVSTSDPWFRPVDVQLGPDGALYIADFYNRIIGHYEVDLHHPGRDRTSGRLWRVVYRGTDGELTSPSLLTTAIADLSSDELIETFADENLTRRLLALNQLCDTAALADVEETLASALRTSAQPHVQSLALWALYRLGADMTDHLSVAVLCPAPLVRVHAMRIAAESPVWSSHIKALSRNSLGDRDSLVRRCAAEALSQHPDLESLKPLLKAIADTPENDPWLSYMLKRAVRFQLMQEDGYAELTSLEIKDEARKLIVEVSQSVPTPAAAEYLLETLSAHPPESEPQLLAMTQHIARHCPPDNIDQLVEITRKRLQDDLSAQVNIIQAIKQSLSASGTPSSGAVNAWSLELSENIWNSSKDELGHWYNTPLSGKPRQDNPWVVERRRSADEDQAGIFFSSLPSGEQATGILRSAPFEIPAKLTFYCAGHIGHPEEPLDARNSIRLRDVATGRVLFESHPPRNDVAQRIEWDLKEHEGRQGQFEIVDGDQRDAYAWLAVGRFEPDVIQVTSFSPIELDQRLQASLDLAPETVDNKMLDQWKTWLMHPYIDVALRGSLADQVARRSDDQRKRALATVIEAPSVSESQLIAVSQAVASPTSQATDEYLQETLPLLPSSAQTKLVISLISTDQGRRSLLDLISSSKVDQRILLNNDLQAAINATRNQALVSMVEKAVKELPPIEAELQQVIAERLAYLDQNSGNFDKGRVVFEQKCAACHQVAGKGEEIGPQLDGIGNRGRIRLAEDTLDPNRNVDAAFRSTTIITIDGQVLVGMHRRTDGETEVFVDREGKEFRLAKEEIEEQEVSPNSLMPSDVATKLSPEEFADLIEFLAQQRAETPPEDSTN